MNIMIVTNIAYLEMTKKMLTSLFQYHPNEKIEIYLPYEDLPVASLESLRVFIEENGGSFTPLYVGDSFKKEIISRNGIAIETYYRILGLALLPEKMERILYLDVDMIIKGNLKELYETDLTGYALAACEDIYGVINGFHEANKKRLGIPKEASYFNAGVLLFHLTDLRSFGEPERMLSLIREHFERYEYNDQDVLNEVYYEKVKYLGWDLYNCPPAYYFLEKAALTKNQLVFASYDEIKKYQTDSESFLYQYQNVTDNIYENARIIHYLGRTKPWLKDREDSMVYRLFDQAYRLYE